MALNSALKMFYSSTANLGVGQALSLKLCLHRLGIQQFYQATMPFNSTHNTAMQFCSAIYPMILPCDFDPQF